EDHAAKLRLLVLEREVAVAGGADADLADLPFHPDVTQAWRPIERIAHQLGELGDRVDRQFRLRRWERHLAGFSHRTSSEWCQPGTCSNPGPCAGELAKFLHASLRARPRSYGSRC